MITNALRSLWAEPRAADAPERVSRDWVLVGVLMVTALLGPAVVGRRGVQPRRTSTCPVYGRGHRSILSASQWAK
jgi:hypothetical protein